MNEGTKLTTTTSVVTEQDKGRCAPAPGSAKPCSLKARKHLPWAIAELEKMEKEEGDPKLRALWRNAAQLGRESLSPNTQAEPRPGETPKP
jgi:hypothetical protein